MKDTKTQASQKQTAAEVLATVGSRMNSWTADEPEAKEPDALAQLKDYIGETLPIPLSSIEFRNNVRREVDRSSSQYTDLLASIKEHGQLSSVVVELEFDGHRHHAYLIAGLHRYSALKDNGAEDIIATVRSYVDTRTSLSISLSENVHRKNLSNIELAQAYSKLKDAGFTVDEISERFEKQPRTVQRYILLASYRPDILKLMHENPDVFTTRVLFSEFVSRKFATQEAVFDKAKAMLLSPSRPKDKSIAFDVSDLKSVEERLRMATSEKAKIRGTDDSGRIEIPYTSKEQLQKLLKALKVKPE